MNSIPRLARAALLVALALTLLQGTRSSAQPSLLPNGWGIDPAGKQISLSTLPMSMAVSPDGAYLLVLNGGFLPPSVSVIDLGAEKEIQRLPVDDGWLGLAFHPRGDKVYVGGGSRVSVFEFTFHEGRLAPARTFPLLAPGKRKVSDHAGDVAVSPDGRFLYAANLFADTVTVMNTQTGFIMGTIRTGRRPYRLLLGLDGKTLLVSHWAEASVGLYRLADGQRIERIAAGAHPTDMLLRPGGMELPNEELPFTARLFVASAHTNSVFVFGISGDNRFRLLERISVSPTPNAPVGSMPTAMALSADKRYLYTVASGNNTIVVADVSEARARLMGVIPTGWFPTAVAALGDGRIAYLNGKGAGPVPNPGGPDPTRRGVGGDYIAALETGSLGIVPPPDEDDYFRYAQRAVRTIPYNDALLADAGTDRDSPIPARPGQPSPIQHVIYIVKENRSYDQVLGDIEEGNGDPDLVVFGRHITPNHHKLAEEFVLLDNFRTDGTVSADGQNWSFAALANDYVQKLWPSYYGQRKRVYDFEGEEPASIPPAGYLWSNALARGLSVRAYGVWAKTGARPGDRPRVTDPRLAPHTNPVYQPFDLNVTDGERVEEFLREYAELESKGELPRLTLIRLPGDHTAGREPGKPTAAAMMAEHDFALGRLVEAVSHSSAWPRTAIFVVEDDAQDGADHLDAHRAPAFVVSPYVRRRFRDSTRYSSVSVLRTIELILGLRPMTQFDAAARPLSRAFQTKPDLRPYTAVKPAIDFGERNPPGPGGRARRVELRIPAPGSSGVPAPGA